MALVGTRRATGYGRAVAERLARELVEAGVTVVSGLARGVDTFSHRAALAAEPDTDPRYEALGQLHDVLAEIDGRLRSHPIGIYFNQQKGRIVDGLELVTAGKQCNSNRWVVRQAGPETATAAVAEDGI